MTRNSSFGIHFLVIVLLCSTNATANVHNSLSAAAGHANETVMNFGARTMTNDMATPAVPAAQPVEPPKRSHLLKTEELAHIHHFHKERVKKLKRHHKKYWLLSKILLILCHLVLLICAYLHMTH